MPRHMRPTIILQLEQPAVVTANDTAHIVVFTSAAAAEAFRENGLHCDENVEVFEITPTSEVDGQAPGYWLWIPGGDGLAANQPTLIQRLALTSDPAREADGAISWGRELANWPVDSLSDPAGLHVKVRVTGLSAEAPLYGLRQRVCT